MKREWNDTGIPIAYLITFRCYGTWLHGDERGSVDKSQNIFGTPYISPNKNLKDFIAQNLTHPPVALDANQRNAVEIAVRDTCKKRDWGLMAINVRTNHVHVVVNAGSKNPNQVLIALKANATREMRARKLWNTDSTPWAENGSKRWLWNENDVEVAVKYVIDGQGDDLPKFG